MDSTSDARLLLARTEDAVTLCEKYSYPHFVGFLDERQRVEAERFLKRFTGVTPLFFGGYPLAERTFLGVFPEYMEPDTALFPLTPLTFSYREVAALTHRDFLGTLLAAGVRRDKIGDIVCGVGKTVAFVSEDVAPFLQEQIVKVGGEGVTVSQEIGMDLPTEKPYREISAIVASPRLDNVVKALTGLSREKAAALIVAGMVSVNHIPCETVTKAVGEGDILSIRGHGRFLMVSLSGRTKKDRWILVAHKYL